MIDSLPNSVFGNLRWEEINSWWFAQIRMRSGEWLDVIIHPGDEDRFSFVESATEFYPRAVDSERRILLDAIQGKLLELYNDTWRQSKDPELTASELMSRLELVLIRFDSGRIPLTLNYVAGDLFGGHGVAVEVDGQLRFQNVNLRG